MSYIGETHLKMTTRARAVYLLKKSDKSDFLKSDPQLFSEYFASSFTNICKSMLLNLPCKVELIEHMSGKDRFSIFLTG